MSLVALCGAVSLASMVSTFPVRRHTEDLDEPEAVYCSRWASKQHKSLVVKRTSLCIVDGEEKSSPDAHTVSVHESNTQ